MKNITGRILMPVLAVLFISGIIITGCRKNEDPIKFQQGTFPDTVQNIAGLNSPYDDYNIDLHKLTGEVQLIFSSNRKSLGTQFDLEQGAVTFKFDQETGAFDFGGEMMDDLFLENLINKAKTARDDFGPYRLYSAYDGNEYFMISSVNTNGDLDLFYLKNRPVFNPSSPPDIFGPFPVTILNSTHNEAYISFDSELDTAYYISDASGNFDIYMKPVPDETQLSEWFNSAYSSSEPVDSINSTSDDKCPIIFRDLMIFTSNRPGGLGGYDLYYSIFRNGKWGSPVNLGPHINSASNEYRPVVGYHPDFKNLFLMFSSDRPGGKGGFDLYFTGFEIPR